MAKYYSPFALLPPSSKTLVYCSEKSNESSSKSFFLLPNPSALYTLILSAWFWREVDEINPWHLHRPTDSAGRAHGTSLLHTLSTGTLSTLLPQSQHCKVPEQQGELFRMLALALFSAVDVFPSSLPCKFSFFSLVTVVLIMRSSNKFCYKLSSWQARSAQ